MHTFCAQDREWQCSVPSVPEDHPGWQKIVQSLVPEPVFRETPVEAFDLLDRLLCLDPAKRITARDALKHPWIVEQCCRACMEKEEK